MKEPGKKDQRGGERSGAGEARRGMQGSVAPARRGEVRYARISGAGEVRSGAGDVSMGGEAAASAVLLK